MWSDMMDFELSSFCFDFFLGFIQLTDFEFDLQDNQRPHAVHINE